MLFASFTCHINSMHVNYSSECTHGPEISWREQVSVCAVEGVPTPVEQSAQAVPVSCAHQFFRTLQP